ncbi:MAG: hypothetical protein R3F55_15495 [Alphaproteobacteria bacterium]
MGADRNLEPAWRPIAGSKRRAVGDQEPATFADRGVAVAFTAARLSQARVRCARRGGLELMVPGYADDGSTYIMPWPAIDQSLGLTAHDHMLHARIGALTTVDPWTVRAVQLAVGAEGLAGPQLLQSSRRALEEDRRAWMGAHLDLIALVCAASDVQIEALRPEDLAAGELPANVRRAFAGFAGSAALSTESCRRLIVEQSVLFAPLGLGEAVPVACAWCCSSCTRPSAAWRTGRRPHRPT